MSFHGGFLWRAQWRCGYTDARPAGASGRSRISSHRWSLPAGGGRVGNFINGELWGRPASADLPWSMVFPSRGPTAAPPSQIYQALGEGLLLFVILWVYSASPRPVRAVSAVFLIGYGAALRDGIFRTPDPGILPILVFSYRRPNGFCVPMILAGVAILSNATRSEGPGVGSTVTKSRL